MVAAIRGEYFGLVKFWNEVVDRNTGYPGEDPEEDMELQRNHQDNQARKIVSIAA